MVNYDTIKHSISISAVLRKYGYPAPNRSSYRIGCPIHGGRDPNFSVSERDGLWNCFSVCGRGGSVIDLVAELEKIPVVDAARKLVDDFDLTPVQSSVAIARNTTSKVEQWKAMKKESPEIAMPHTIELEEGYRNLTRKTIDHWGLRRTNENSRFQYGGNTPRGESNPLMVPDGVVIPLLNAHGGVCSYSVRKDEGTPKYWNSPGSARCGMMGLYTNKKEIIKAGFVYICEGQFDCISLWQRGFRNVVALRGSSLTEPQAMLLLQLTSKLTLLLDGDGPGIEAAKKLKSQWQKIFDITIITLPDQKDPDELTVRELNNLLA